MPLPGGDEIGPLLPVDRLGRVDVLVHEGPEPLEVLGGGGAGGEVHGGVPLPRRAVSWAAVS